MAKRPSVWPYLWMLCGSLAFALMGTFAHILRSYCDWQVVAVARAGLPLLFALGLALAGGAKLVLWRPRTLWIRSIAGSLSLVCMFFALTHMPVSDVFTLNNMFPIWVALLSWPLFNEQPTGQVWASVASGIAGMVLVQQPHLAGGNVAAIYAAASSILTAIAMLGLHHLQEIDPRAIVVHFSGVALVICMAAFFVFDRETEVPQVLAGQPLLLLVGMGVSATIGQLFLTKAFAAGPPAKIAVVGLTQIVWSMLFDHLFFGTFAPLTFLGMGLILAPTAWLMLNRAAASHDLDEAADKEPAPLQ